MNAPEDTSRVRHRRQQRASGRLPLVSLLGVLGLAALLAVLTWLIFIPAATSAEAMAENLRSRTQRFNSSG